MYTDDYVLPPGAEMMTLSAFSFPSFAGSIAGVASGLPLFFHGGFPRGPLSEFHIAGLLLGFQGNLTSGSLGSLCRGQGSSLRRSPQPLNCHAVLLIRKRHPTLWGCFTSSV
jgi:hypothetical protein